MRILDHAGIYVLIAGSFTAIHSVLFRGVMRWGIILLVWVLAVNGIVLGTIFFNDMPEWLSLTFFLGLGWIGVISAAVLWKKKGFYFIRYFVYGGLAYTLGAVLEFFKIPVLIRGVVGPHELFHIAVIMGASFHWLFVLKSIDLNAIN
jgi:channel protein (hemolysin III family)